MANLYDKAGLVNIPVGYQEGFLYNIKPTDNTLAFRFNRDSAATRVNKEGLIEQVGYFGPELVTNGDFSTDSDWTKGSAWTIANGQASYDASAITSIKSATTSMVSGKTYRLKFKITTSGFARLNFTNDSSQALFEPNGNSVNNFDSDEYTFYLSAQNNSTALKIFAYNNSSGTSFSIDNVSVTEVIGDKPRIDYTDSLTSPSFLLEPQSTNLIAYSEDFSQPTWNKSNTSIQINTTTSPSGNFDGSTLTDNATSSIHRLRDAVSLSASTNYSLSVFAKKNTLSNIQLALINTANSNTISKVFDLENGVIGEELSQGGTTVSDAKIENYGNGWFRCVIVGQLNSAPNQYQITLATKSTGNSQSVKQVTYSGDGTGSVFLYGAQIEQKSYSTSYIPTYGSTATRAQETCNSAGSASTFNSTEGVLYADIAALADDLTFRSIALSDGTNNNRVLLRYRTNSNQINLFIKANGTTIVNSTKELTDITNFSKFAIKYKSGDIALWIDGVEAKTNTNTFTLIGLDRLNFDAANGSDDFYGKTKGIYVFNEALTDDELQQLTT